MTPALPPGDEKDGSEPPLARRFALAFLVTAGGIVLAHALATLAGPEATLQRVSIVFVLGATLVAASLWGRGPAVVSGALGGAYTVLFFATFGTQGDLGMRVMLGSAIGAAILGFTLLVGALRSRADRALAAERERTRALRHKAAELAEANAGLARANDALQFVNEGLEAFAYVVAHDLKEPVRAMAALLEDAEGEAVRPVVRENVHAARVANERLAKLLAGLLEVARASRLDPHAVRPVDPIVVLGSDSCVARYGAIRDERHARVESSSLVGTPPVLATEEHVSQILGNLVLNAIRHNDKTSPLVRVRVAPQDAEGTMVLVSVEDDGPGFDPRVVDQAGRSKPGRIGTIKGGFGLVIVRRAVERLGGSVWFGRSEDLGGAAVHFTVPAASTTPRAGRGAGAGNATGEQVPRGPARG